MVVHLHSGIILFAKCSILIVWQCSGYVSASITAQYSYAANCIRHITNSGILNTLVFKVYVNHIQRY